MAALRCRVCKCVLRAADTKARGFCRFRGCVMEARKADPSAAISTSAPTATPTAAVAEDDFTEETAEDEAMAEDQDDELGEDQNEAEKPWEQTLAYVPHRDPNAPAYFCGAKAPWSPVVRFCTLLPGHFPERPHAAIGNRYVVRFSRTVAVPAPVWWNDTGWLAHPDDTVGRA